MERILRGLLAFLLLGGVTLATQHLTHHDPHCHYMALTRPHEEYDPVTLDFEVATASGGTELKEVQFCLIKEGFHCYPEGTEAFSFERHLSQEMGIPILPPVDPKNHHVPVDTFRDYERELKGISCASGSCTQKIHGVCNGTDDLGRRTVKWAGLETRLQADPESASLTDGMFQRLRDICYYVRKTRFAVYGDKGFHPAVGRIQWRPGGPEELIELCHISLREKCWPRTPEEELNFLEYLHFLQGNRSAIKPTPSNHRKKGPEVVFRHNLYYYYRPEVVERFLSWTCDTGICELPARKCVPDKKKIKTEPDALHFYEYEEELERMKPRSQGQPLRSRTAVIILAFSIGLLK